LSFRFLSRFENQFSFFHSCRIGFDNFGENRGENKYVRENNAKFFENICGLRKKNNPVRENFDDFKQI
jgi:hypothetical protein